MSERQRRFIEEAARQRSMYWADVEQMCWGAFGMTTKEITSTQARQLCMLIVRVPLGSK